MRPVGTFLAATLLSVGALALHRAAFSRRRPAAPSPECSNSLPLSDGACGMTAANKAPQLLTHHQSDESRRWHLSRAEDRRIRRAYRRMRLDIESRLDNPAWPHPSTGRAA